MWIRVVRLGEGQHPSESVIGVKDSDGVVERIVVDKRSIDNMHIDVGFPVGADDSRYLVELPRETSSGQWRIWLNQKDVLDRIPA